MHHKLSSTTLGLTLAAGFAGSASAATLVDFRFDPGGNIDETSPYSGGSTSTADNVSIATGLAVGSGIRGGNGVNIYDTFGLFDGPATDPNAPAHRPGHPRRSHRPERVPRLHHRRRRRLRARPRRRQRHPRPVLQDR